MKIVRTLAGIAVLAGTAWLTTAAALGLGEIDVKSKLNQRFTAVVPLSVSSDEEAETALVSLASNDDFARAGIERTDYLSTLKFAIKTDGGNPRIVITSQQPAREPYLSLLLDVRGKNSRVLREYTALLDPPDLVVPSAKPAPAPAAPVAATTPARSASDFYETPEERARRQSPMPATPAAPARPATTTPAPVSTPAAATAVTYGPVQASETLWSIATKLRPDSSVTMDQVLLAIYQQNPKAFDGLQGLRKGAVLKIPTLSQIQANNAAQAKLRIAELRGASPAPSASQPAQKSVVSEPKIDLPSLSESKPAKPAVPAEKTATPVTPPAPKASAPAVAAPAKAETSASPKTEPAPQAKVETKPAASSTTPAGKAAEADKPLIAAAPPPAAPAASSTTPAATPAAAQPATTAASAAPSATEEPLIPETPAADTSAAQQPSSTPPVIVPPMPEPEPDSSSGLLLWLAIVVVFLAAGGFFGWRYWKQRRTQAKPITIKDVYAASAAAAAKAEAAPERIAPIVPAASAATDGHEDLGLQMPAFDVTSEQPAQKFAHTAQMTTPGMVSATQTLEAKLPQVAPAAAEHVDFDVTSQFAAETMSINLDANDPVSEADFHLAYGLYDEAALLLRQAAERDPKRSEIRVKLAETYFAASKSQEFVSVAQTLKGELSDSEWQKIAIMGQQLAPESALFDDAGDAVALTSDIDLAFDEPTPSAASTKANDDLDLLSFDVTPSASATPSPAPAPADDFAALDFKLEEFELPKLDEPKIEIPKASDSSLDFKLDDIDLSGTSPGKPALSLAEPSLSATPTAAPASFDSTGAIETLAFNISDSKADSDELKLDDEFSLDSSSAISGGDEAGTKLDLARAYADMGDNDMARTLLKEVLDQGNAQQQKEAQALLGRLA